MLLDLLFGFFLVLSTLFGFKDGIVRKLVSTIAMMIGVFVGQSLMRRTGSYLVDSMDFDKSTAPMLGFLFVFIAVILAQSLLYRILASNYKIGGLADRIGGAALGLGQGMLFLSSMLFILAMGDMPSRETRRESSLYKTVVNMTPVLLDFFVALAPDVQERLNDAGKYDVKLPATPKMMVNPLPSAVDSSAVLRADKQKEMFDKARKKLR